MVNAMNETVRRWKGKIVPERYELFGFIIVYIALFLLTINYKLFSDDANHYETIKQVGIWDLYIQHVTTWQPRIISYFLTDFFVVYDNVWKFVAPLPIAAVLFDFYHVIKRKSDIRLLILTFSVVFLISPAVINICFLWISGWTNYVFLFALMWFALKPIFKLTQGVSDGGLDSAAKKIIYFIVAFSACWSEQFAVMLIGFVVYAVGLAKLKKHSISITMWAYLALLPLTSMLFIYLNFKSPRAHDLTETLFFPDFDMRSLPDKFFQMLNLTNNNLVFDSQFIMLPLLCMIAYVIYNRHKTFVRYYGFLPLGLQVLLTFPFKLLLGNQIHSSTPLYIIFNYISTGYDINSFDIPVNSLFVPLCTTMIVVLIGFSMFLIFDVSSERFTAFTLWLGGLGCSYILMFSPTMYASGNRLFFLLDMILVFLFVGVNRQAIQMIKSETVKNIYVMTLLGAAIFIWCNLFVYSNVLHINLW